MIQFLFDEDVTPALRDAENERGYLAFHVQYRGWKGRKDSDILSRMSPARTSFGSSLRRWIISSVRRRPWT